MKKIMIAVVGVGLLGFAVFTQMALGSRANNDTTGTPVSTSTPIVTRDTTTIPMLIKVNPDGTIIMRGTVVSVGSSSLVVRSRGGSWNIQTGSSTRIMNGKGVGLAGLIAGDFVGISGVISELTDWTIDADVVRYWGTRADNDRDGIPNAEDQDDDNDGIKDRKDRRPFDHDNDGMNDIVDLDDDGDGINDDRDEHLFDHDNDNEDDDEDEDDDNDGTDDDEDDDDDEREDDDD